MGLFEDLPDATDAGGEVEGSWTKTPGRDGSAVAAAGRWSGAGSKLRAPTRRPPASLPSAHALKAQAAALRAQQVKRRASLASNAEANAEAIAEARGEDDRGADAAERDATERAGTWGTMSAAVEDEYVPSRPNSYEALARARAETRAREEIETAREARRLVLEGQRAARAAMRRAASGGAGGFGSERDRLRLLDVTGEEAFARRATFGASGARGSGGDGKSGTEGAAVRSAGAGGESLGMKMMKKMGYKEGRGLGKNDQGMVTHLEVRKDSARSGIIVHAPGKPCEAAKNAS